MTELRAAEAKYAAMAGTARKVRGYPKETQGHRADLSVEHRSTAPVSREGQGVRPRADRGVCVVAVVGGHL